MAITISVPAGNFHLAGNPINVIVSGAVAPAGSSNYKITLKITSVDSLLFGSPFIDAIAPVSGQAIFDCSGYIDQPLFRVFEFPLVGGFNPYVNDTFDVVFTPGESWIDANGDLQESWGTPTNTHFVVKGGVSMRQLGVYYDTSVSFYQDYVVGGKFLTHMPSTQIVSPTQPTKLWVLSAVTAPAHLRIRATYSDGSFYLYTNTHAFFADIIHELNCLPSHADGQNMPMVKYNQSGAILATMTKYEVWFEGQTETRTFTVDHGIYENNNYLFILNSLGGIDVIWLHGHVKREFASEISIAEKPRSNTDGLKVPTRIVSSKSGIRKWTINTGYKTPDEIDALIELALSKQSWLFIDSKLYPVIISLDQEIIRDSIEFLNSLDITIEEAHTNSWL